MKLYFKELYFKELGVFGYLLGVLGYLMSVLGYLINVPIKHARTFIKKPKTPEARGRYIGVRCGSGGSCQFRLLSYTCASPQANMVDVLRPDPGFGY